MMALIGVFFAKCLDYEIEMTAIAVVLGLNVLINDSFRHRFLDLGGLGEG